MTRRSSFTSNYSASLAISLWRGAKHTPEIKTAFEENEIRLAPCRVIVEAISRALAAKATQDILKIEAENRQQFGVNRA